MGGGEYLCNHNGLLCVNSWHTSPVHFISLCSWSTFIKKKKNTKMDQGGEYFCTALSSSLVSQSLIEFDDKTQHRCQGPRYRGANASRNFLLSYLMEGFFPTWHVITRNLIVDSFRSRVWKSWPCVDQTFGSFYMVQGTGVVQATHAAIEVANTCLWTWNEMFSYWYSHFQGAQNGPKVCHPRAGDPNESPALCPSP